jgi:DNA integrity scanning protein DisA with diadenylate cyclase activity
VELSRQIGINPFKGHSISIQGRENWELVKKYAVALEGAFLIRRDGTIVSGDVYLCAERDVDIPCGLGTRHRGVAKMTAATKAIGVVASEGDRQVRMFQGGRLVGVIDSLSEAWVED